VDVCVFLVEAWMSVWMSVYFWICLTCGAVRTKDGVAFVHKMMQEESLVAFGE
jgi:hypothetical protein